MASSRSLVPATVRETLAVSAQRINRAASRLPGLKSLDFLDPSNGQGVGWSRGGVGVGLPGPQIDPGPRIEDLLGTYGGTEYATTWVYTCVKTVAQQMAGYPWETTKDPRRPTEKRVTTPDDLMALLLEPSSGETYSTFAFLQQADLELIGNSYWLKDNRDLEGKPEEMLRLMPQFVKIVVDKADRKVGYVYEVQGILIPFTLDQIIHFRQPNPMHPHYGIGTVEAIIRAIGQELSQSAHVTGFFQSGAHLSGVLTIPETLGEEEFERIKRQYQEEFARSTNQFRVLIAEGATSYSQMTGTPAAIGIVDLREASKDEIFTGFGVPEILAGGSGVTGVSTMEEAQNILQRNMVPKATLYNERMTIDLTSRWDGLGFRCLPEQSEPRSMKIERSRNMLGSGGSLNDARREQGLDPVKDKIADEPLVPGGLIPMSQLAQHHAKPRPGEGPITTVDNPHVVGNGNEPANAPSVPPSRRAPGTLAVEVGPGAEAISTPYARGDGTIALLPPIPTLPPGYEDWSDWRSKKIDDLTARQHMTAKAGFLARAVPTLQAQISGYFVAQRRRVLGRLDDLRSATPRAKGEPYGGKAPSIDRAWNDEFEELELEELAADVVDSLGGHLPIDWNPDDAAVKQIRERIVTDIVGINETTRDRLREVIVEGVRRGYSLPQIANGQDSEDYPGVSGVFDAAAGARAATIARTESNDLYNLAAVEDFDRGGFDEVEVMDGNYDPACEEADGQVWTLAQARARPSEHPNCVRTFLPLEGSAG